MKLMESVVRHVGSGDQWVERSKFGLSCKDKEKINKGEGEEEKPHRRRAFTKRKDASLTRRKLLPCTGERFSKMEIYLHGIGSVFGNEFYCEFIV